MTFFPVMTGWEKGRKSTVESEISHKLSEGSGGGRGVNVVVVAANKLGRLTSCDRQLLTLSVSEEEEMRSCDE